MKKFESNAQRFETVCFSIFNKQGGVVYRQKKVFFWRYTTPPYKTHERSVFFDLGPRTTFFGTKIKIKTGVDFKDCSMPRTSTDSKEE